jgi:hypothetical protein
MELSPSWETISCIVTQELLSILWNLKVCYRIHMNPPPIPILSQISSPYYTILSLFKIHLINIQALLSWSSYWPFSFWLSHQCSICIPISPICVTCPSHLILIDLIILTLHRKEYKFWSLIMQFPPTSCHLIATWPKFSPQYSVLKHHKSVKSVSSRMLHHVALLRTDISEECIASIIRATGIDKLGTMLVAANIGPSSPILVTQEATWHNVPEDCILHSHCCENLISYIGSLCSSLNVRDKVSHQYRTTKKN